jgi:hypothetical protein
VANLPARVGSQPSTGNPTRREVDVFKKQASYANVIASLALFIALGGTATAAVTLGRDSVGSA